MTGASPGASPGEPQGATVGPPGHVARAGRRAEHRAGALAHPQASLAMLRLVAGSVMLAGVVLFVFGTSWDIQWHSFIGRDRALVPPHLLMLSGILLSGVVALAEIGVESFWARTNASIAELSTPFAGAFYGSLGAYVAGFAALAAAVGFPLDVYWHSLYGIDVSVWAPFHVMIITGMSIVALGVCYLLLSGANLAVGVGLSTAARAGRLGVSVALAGMLVALFFYLDASFSNAAISLGAVRIDTFALMVGAFGGFALALAVAALPWRLGATSVVTAYYAIDLVVFLLVPPLTDALVIAENQTYRRGHPTFVVVPELMPLTLILAAGALDFAAGHARRLQLSALARRHSIQVAAVIGLGLTALLDPLYLAHDLPGGRFLARLALFVVALLLGLVGAWLGSWLGLDVGDALARAER